MKIIFRDFYSYALLISLLSAQHQSRTYYSFLPDINLHTLILRFVISEKNILYKGQKALERFPHVGIL